MSKLAAYCKVNMWISKPQTSYLIGQSSTGVVEVGTKENKRTRVLLVFSGMINIGTCLFACNFLCSGHPLTPEHKVSVWISISL